MGDGGLTKGQFINGKVCINSKEIENFKKFFRANW